MPHILVAEVTHKPRNDPRLLTKEGHDVSVAADA